MNYLHPCDRVELEHLLEKHGIPYYYSDVNGCLCFHYNGCAYCVDQYFDYYACKRLLNNL